MKIKTKAPFEYKIIDLINESPGLITALTTTAAALAILWAVGFFVLQKSI